MKYWYTDLYKKKNWLETDETDPLKIIKRYYNAECIVHDADVCGDEEIFFIFDTNIAYCLSYNWWIEYDPEWEIFNEHYIKEVPLLAFKYPENRDWLDLKR